MSISCSTTKSQVEQSSYTNCLPEQFREDLNIFVKSFDEFVSLNYEGKIESFVSSILNRNFPDKSFFTKSDYELAQKLRSNGFRDYIYTEYEEKFSDMEIAPPRTANDSKDESRKKIIVDFNKPYLNCFSNIETNGSLIKNYVELQKENGSVSYTHLTLPTILLV